MKEYEKAPLWRHTRVYHGGQKVPDWYHMKVERSHRTPLGRQVSEGVEINQCKADIIMNSKGEWNGSRLPRMIIERGDKIQLDEDDINVRMMNWEKKPKEAVELLVLSDSVKRKVFQEEVEDEVESGRLKKRRKTGSMERVNTPRLKVITDFFCKKETQVGTVDEVHAWWSKGIFSTKN